jgi:peptidoglycan L-alanyl-D-glutamate endopeptidase CwlK
MDLVKIRQIQRVLVVKDDGFWGPQSRAAMAAILAPDATSTISTQTDSAAEFDSRSEAMIASLIPGAREVAREFLRRCRAAGNDVRIISGTRTYDEQDALFAKGRSQPGRVVTNARGGYSNHNFGIAFDIGIFFNGHYIDDVLTEEEVSRHYRAVSTLRGDLPLDWGGDWRSFQDEPHYELRPPWRDAGIAESEFLAELRRRHEAGEPLA